MIVAAIVQARMGSTRLPGKVLAEVAGRPMLAHLLERAGPASLVDRLLVATSDDPADDPIEAFCSSRGIGCFRGSLHDCLDRYYRAAAAVRAGVVARLTADNPLVDPAMIDRVIRFRAERGLDFAVNSPPSSRTVPFGMDVEVFTFDALARAHAGATRPSEREHVTFHFWKNPERFACGVLDHARDGSRYRLTVDYPEDLEVVGRILEHEADLGRRLDLEGLLDYLEAHPGVAALNSHIAPYQGWIPSLEKDRELGFGT